MWISARWLTLLIEERTRYMEAWQQASLINERLNGEITALKQQKSKDDVTIDWMRHRINALEKQNAALLMKAGIPVPVPDIVSDRPGSISQIPADLQFMPSFEDVGDLEASRLGVEHDEDGTLIFRK